MCLYEVFENPCECFPPGVRAVSVNPERFFDEARELVVHSPILVCREVLHEFSIFVPELRHVSRLQVPDSFQHHVFGLEIEYFPAFVSVV